jgi:hypothetical protein
MSVIKCQCGFDRFGFVGFVWRGDERYGGAVIGMAGWYGPGGLVFALKYLVVTGAAGLFVGIAGLGLGGTGLWRA